DPVTFMEQVAGSTDEYRVDQITEQMRAEVIGAFQNVLNELGTAAHKVPVMELPSRTDEIKKTMDEKVFDAPIRERGLQLRGFIVESVSLDDESSKKIDNYELSSNSMMQQGTLVGAYANAVQDAANNENGAGQGFMGLGMMNMSSGGMIGGAVNTPFQNQAQAQPMPAIDPYQQQPASTNGATPEVAQTKFCSNCGKPVEGNFCSNCGTKLV
ncbi:MAG: SPFH domain-containing protein, partial [Bacilli bacterium]|nr:SPFH domain-containing protein [Bacilli bacterium]